MQLSECFGLPGPSKTIDIHEFTEANNGEPVRVTVEMLTVRQQAEVETLVNEDKGEEAIARTIIYGCRHTETGKPLFTADQLDKVLSLPISVSNQITEALRELRTVDRVAEFKKKSETPLA